MTTASLKVINSSGLHARPAALFIREAKKHPCIITLHKDGSEPVNGKSIAALLAAGIDMGDTVTVSADGEGEADAIQAISALFESGFGE